MLQDKISYQDYFKFSSLLEEKHALFYKMWELGKPRFSKEIPTAAVRFNKEGNCIEFVFNPDFWNKINDYERLFVICHECMHVLLNHGFRIAGLKGSPIVNIALDIVDNGLLVKRFGFDRKQISFEKDLCWIDTVFKDSTKVKDDQTFEYYYNLLLKNQVNIKGGSPSDSFDDHSGLPDILKDIVEKLGESLSDQEKSSVEDIMRKFFECEDKEDQEKQAGKIPGCGWTIVNAQYKPKKKWETVIKKWSKKYNKNNYKTVEQWARTNRRMTMLGNGLFLPSDMEHENKDDGKIEVWFFQDTSGSCRGLAPRFFKAAKSLPKDRFDVKMFCFDTRVYETSLESGKLYGFGGTSFSILEKYILEHSPKKYPEAVFVITDGYGNRVDPKYPKKWYWFLSHDYRVCINENCNIFDLKKFE